MKYIVIAICLLLIGYAFFILIRSFGSKANHCKGGCDGCQHPCPIDGDAICRYRDDQKTKKEN